MLHTSTHRMNKRESARVSLLKPFGCVACICLGGRTLYPLELHHLLDGGRRMGHFYTIFLCRAHHQGTGEWPRWVGPLHRVSINSGSQAWLAVYPSQRELWEYSQRLIDQPQLWPVSKILPRRIVTDSIDKGTS